MRYQFTGDGPVVVPDLGRGIDKPVMPGEVFETDVEINNATFKRLGSKSSAAAVVEPAPPAPEEA